MVWLKFAVSLVLILIAGTKLARYGDALAEKTRLGGIWIGLVLLAFITSVPELATGISAAALVKIPDLALGTIMGSCIFNLLIIAFLDMVYQRGPILSKASPRHQASAVLGIVLIGLAALAIFAGERLSGLALGWIGVPSIVLVALYLAGVRWTLGSGRGEEATAALATSSGYGHMSMREVWLKFILGGVVVAGSGIWLAFIGEEIAATTGLASSFVGSLFLAVSTSMPEIALTIAAVRLGAIDMAMADALGANMINIAKLFFIDMFYAGGPILSSVSTAHVTTALVAVGMSLVVLVALRFRERRKTFGVISWYTVLLLGMYSYGAYALYTSGVGA